MPIFLCLLIANNDSKLILNILMGDYQPRFVLGSILLFH